ncbi:hypothetical protein C8R46DRAFT_1341889 [Mycena filopes]|nr:hypothetical protein C8R46DRAFT_1341889 [Mycena filopes]
MAERLDQSVLPPEIVAKIFIAFLPVYPDFPPLSGALSPLFLCRICRRWREIALSTPQLWSAIAIAVGRNPTAHLELLETWLARSGNCPLSFRLSDAAKRPHHLQTALLHLHRWQYIVLDLPFEQLVLVQGEMPLLREVTLTPPGGSLPLELFQRAPRLKSVVLSSHLHAVLLVLPWAQLTHFEGHLIGSQIVDVLGNAVNLTHATFYIIMVGSQLASMTGYRSHERLRHMCIRLRIVVNHAPESTLLGRLILPALRTLRADEPCLTTNSITADALTAFIARSGCTLDELHVVGAAIPGSSYGKEFPAIRLITVKPLAGTMTDET